MSVMACIYHYMKGENPFAEHSVVPLLTQIKDDPIGLHLIHEHHGLRKLKVNPNPIEFQKTRLVRLGRFFVSLCCDKHCES